MIGKVTAPTSLVKNSFYSLLDVVMPCRLILRYSEHRKRGKVRLRIQPAIDVLSPGGGHRMRRRPGFTFLDNLLKMSKLVEITFLRILKHEPY